MSLIDTLIGTVVPHDCLGCGYEGRLVCAGCAAKLKNVPERCYRCYGPSPGALTCEACRRSSLLRRVHTAMLYEGVVKDLIWQLKFHGAQTAAQIMAERMAPLLCETRDETHSEAVLVPVPTATSRARGRGYDQAKLLARELARQTGLPYADCLRRSGQTHQVGASRGRRLEQLQTAFRVKTSRLPIAATIILVDDVLTTGATLEAAAAALKRTAVDAAVFARA